MAWKSVQGQASAIRALSHAQHGVVTRKQLLNLGLGSRAIEHRLERGRLHRLRRGVYAVGRPEVSRLGRWVAAVLSCGPEALLGFRSAAALWGMIERAPNVIEVIVPSDRHPRQPGIRVHRRAVLRPEDRQVHQEIPLTSPAATLVDCASQVGSNSLEAMVNAADRLDLIDPEKLRLALDATPPRPGLPALRRLLDRKTFTRTDSELERRFLRLIRSARLPHH